MIRRTLLTVLCLGSAGVSVACAGGDNGAFTSLPPIATTSTTTTTTTTISTDRIFYTIKPGEGLSIIAESFGVTVQSIVDLNDSIENPDNIQADQRIEIPRGIQIVTELPNQGGDGNSDTEDSDG